MGEIAPGSLVVPGLLGSGVIVLLGATLSGLLESGGVVLPGNGVRLPGVEVPGSGILVLPGTVFPGVLLPGAGVLSVGLVDPGVVGLLGEVISEGLDPGAVLLFGVVLSGVGLVVLPLLGELVSTAVPP